MAEGDNNNDHNNNQISFSCCNDAQHAFLYLYLIYLIIVLLTGDTLLAKPMRLLATSVHEVSHALLCWLTGGRVHKLEVYNNEGGVTHYSGGWRCCIAPAGYLGEAAWGFGLTVLSGGQVSSTLAAGVLVTALLVSLCYSPNRTLVVLNLSYATLLIVVTIVEWCYFTPLLPYVTLLFGVYLSTYAIIDIFSHLILRSNPQSDAYTIYEESGYCCPPRCVGLWWMILAILLQLLGLYVGLILMCDECQDMGWFQCIFHSKLDLEFESLRDFDWWPDDWEFRGFNNDRH